MNATYVILGLSIAMATLLAVNAITSAAVMLVTAIVAPAREAETSLFAVPAAYRATLFFLLRILPALIAVAVVGLLCVPSYLEYEPGRTSERVGPVLAVLATVALGLALGTAWRAVACWRATNRLARQWRAVAQPLDLRERHVTEWRHAAYRLDHSFPVMAVIGTFRPQLFVSNAVLDALADDELAAAVAHEQAHVDTADNLRRVLMRSARDVFGFSSLSRRIDRLWADAAETAADESVARLGRNAALSLASALLKIARQIPTGHTSAFGVSSPPIACAFLVAPGEPLIERKNAQHARSLVDDVRIGVAGRVRRLVDLADDCTVSPRGGEAVRIALVMGAATVLFGLAVSPMTPWLLTATHAAIEHVLRRLT